MSRFTQITSKQLNELEEILFGCLTLYILVLPV